MAENPPYMNAYGRLRKILEKIKEAAPPARFTQDFLNTKLNMKGGSANQAIPFLKRIGFLGSDGVPTELYRRFRNTDKPISGSAVAEGMKIGYKSLYERNEYLHDMADDKFKGLVVEATGLENSSTMVRSICGSYKTLKEFADFESNVRASAEEEKEVSLESITEPAVSIPIQQSGVGLNLSYTINLNLPAVSDITVFNAIFKSLKENLLKNE